VVGYVKGSEAARRVVTLDIRVAQNKPGGCASIHLIEKKGTKTMDYKNIISGIDTIVVGYAVNGYKDGVGDLAVAKAASKSTQFENDNGVVKLGGVELQVQPRGARGYEYVAVNGDMVVKVANKVTGGEAFPEVMVELRSNYLWREGWQNALDRVTAWVNQWAMVKSDKVSRVDLCADFACGLPVLDNDFEGVVTRAMSRKAFAEKCPISKYKQGLKMSGYSFGKGEMMCRIYNKTLEIEKTGKQWFYDLWAKHGYQEGDITRVEFQFRRDALRYHQINTIQDLKLQVADLWHYATNKWLMLKEIRDKEKTHKLRWLTTEFWFMVQKVRSFFGELTGVLRLKQFKPKYKQLTAQCRGLIVSIAAMAGISLTNNPAMGIKQVQAYLHRVLMDDELFISVYNRMNKYALCEVAIPPND